MASSNDEGKRGQVDEGGNSSGSRSVDCGRARARSSVLSSVDWVQRRSLCLLWAQVAAGQKKEKKVGWGSPAERQLLLRYGIPP